MDLAKKAFLDGIDVVTFTSSSTVRNLVEILDGDRAGLDASFIACIGPVTAATAREMGLRVDLEATEHTVEGLVDALTNHFAEGELSRK
jgi:uroporphyrinogen-III synthase